MELTFTMSHHRILKACPQSLNDSCDRTHAPPSEQDWKLLLATTPGLIQSPPWDAR